MTFAEKRDRARAQANHASITISEQLLALKFPAVNDYDEKRLGVLRAELDRLAKRIARIELYTEIINGEGDSAC